ncbi:hypothetical protein BMB171_C2723 [Bacillus thuringiensis BMB171]|nr:hypothetical protein BMB171_C2723 [Bacillus thuringiensis BMB171]
MCSVFSIMNHSSSSFKVFTSITIIVFSNCFTKVYSFFFTVW